jgi:hypothetical protein
MTTHYHLVVQILEGGLSKGMQELNGEYARRTNYRHRRVGHLFQNRFFADWITSDRHLFGAIRYVALNPVRAGICAAPEGWEWSSHRASVGLEFPIDYLTLRRVLRLFGTRPKQARESYLRLIRSGKTGLAVKARADEARVVDFISLVLR